MSRLRPMLPSGVRRLARLPWNAARMRRELDDEVRFHLEMRVDELRARGMSEREAREEALRRFGDSQEFRDYCARVGERRARWNRFGEGVAEWRQDIHFAYRQFVKAPAVAAIALATLALGIGANAAIFSVVHHLLLSPLPYAEGNRIVALRQEAGDGNMFFPVDATLMNAWQGRVRGLLGFAASAEGTIRLGDAADDSLPGAAITSQFLRTLRVQPALGRDFTDEESRSRATDVVMIGYSMWQRRYDGRRDVLGATIRVDGQPRIIVGVAPKGLVIPMSSRPAPEVLLPTNFDSLRGSFLAFARLRAGVSTATASRELQSIVATLPNRDRYRDTRARAMRAQEFLDVREAKSIRILFVAVGVLLLIACANVANLLLARAWTRRREFAIRAALGAGRARLVRQVLTESLLLALLGGAMGLLVAWQTLRIIVAMRPPSLEHLAGIHVEPAVLFWSAAISLSTGVLFGLAPALVSGARSHGGTLRRQAGSAVAGVGVAARRLRAGLVILEVALSLVLLVSGGLLARSFLSLRRMEVGFDARELISVGTIIRGRPDSARQAALWRHVVSRLRAVPGVYGASIGPMPGQGWIIASNIEVEEHGRPREAGVHEFTNGFVSADYFSVARIAVVEGRLFDSTASNDPQVVVNESFARRLWPNGGAIGSRLRSNPRQPWSVVVGIVRDVRVPRAVGDRETLQMYVAPLARVPGSAFLARTTLGPSEFARVFRGIVRDVDPSAIAGSSITGESYLRDALAPSRFSMALLGAFGLLALILASVGLYGVISYAVSQRTHEIGVRVAMGAHGGAVARLILLDGMRLAGVGIVIGLGAAAAATRALASMLYGVGAADPPTFAATALFLVMVAALASYLPARRALRINPIDALRAE